MRIGLFFGSFNPIHTGHLIIANCIADKLDKIWFIVSPQNPLKSSDLLPAKSRLALTSLAIEDDKRFAISDIEFHLPLPSFTINTLKELTRNHPEDEFIIIIGSDNYNNFSQWKDADKIAAQYSILVYERPGFPAEYKSYTAEFLKAPLIEISSTIIRNLIKEGKSIRYLVPEKVRTAIEASEFYK